MADSDPKAFAQAGHPAARGGSKTSGAAQVARISHGSGGGHHAPQTSTHAQMAQRYWDADDGLPKHRKGNDMSAAPREHPNYARLEFPEYEYREYPMMIYLDNADDHMKPVYVNGVPSAGTIVNDEDELERALSTRAAPVRESDEKARLLALADVDGVQVDKRWSVNRLAKAIEDAGFDATANPFE